MSTSYLPHTLAFIIMWLLVADGAHAQTTVWEKRNSAISDDGSHVLIKVGDRPLGLLNLTDLTLVTPDFSNRGDCIIDVSITAATVALQCKDTPGNPPRYSIWNVRDNAMMELARPDPRRQEFLFLFGAERSNYRCDANRHVVGESKRQYS